MRPEAPTADPETAIMICVREFYDEARGDPLLGPIFRAAVHDWEIHYKIVADFWSRALLGTERYQGHPFPLHAKLPVEPEHFDRWLALFVTAAETHLPLELAQKAIAKARHMADSFKAGIFPFLDAQGRLSRLPA